VSSICVYAGNTMHTLTDKLLGDSGAAPTPHSPLLGSILLACVKCNKHEPKACLQKSKLQQNADVCMLCQLHFSAPPVGNFLHLKWLLSCGLALL